MPLFDFLRHFKIRTKLSLVIITLITFIVVGILYIAYIQDKRIHFREIEQRASDIAHLLAFNSVQAVLLDDYLTLQNLIDSISNRKSVLQAMVLDNDGRVVVHNHIGERGKIYSDSCSSNAIEAKKSTVKYAIHNKQRILVVSVPIFISSQKRATARIFFSLDDAYAAIYKTAMNIILIGAFGIILSIVLIYFISRIITGSILELVQATKRIGKGERDIQIKIKSNDEIGELGAAFNTMIKDIANLENNIRSSERLTTFGLTAAALAHKIKTPFTSVRTFVELLPERYHDEEFRKTFQHHILLQINKIDKIISDLLNFSRNRKFTFSTHNINKIIGQLIQSLQERIENTNIQIITHLDNLPLACVDEKQFLEALLIIGNNAIETLSGTGQIRIQTTHNETDNKVIVTISDTGKGIAPENLDKIFDSFFSTKSKGMGIGLAICAKIIECHSGIINVESEVGKGSTFKITLPVDNVNV